MKKEAIRKTLATLFLSVATFWIGNSLSFLYTALYTHKTECGTVAYKGSKEGYHKYSSSTDYILSVDYGSYRADKTVTFTTWSTHEVGSRICFEKPPLSGSAIEFVKMCTAGLTLFAIAIGVLWLAICSVIWLFTGEWN